MIDWDDQPLFKRPRNAAAFLRQHFGMALTVRDLAKLRAKDTGPPWTWVYTSSEKRKTYRYRPEDLAAWAAKQEHAAP